MTVMPPSSPLRMDMRSMSKDDLKYIDSTILVQLKRCMQRQSVIPSTSRPSFSRQKPLMDSEDLLTTRRCSYIYHGETDTCGTSVVPASKGADPRGLLMLMICYFYSILMFFMAAFVAYFFISIKRKVMLELAFFAKRLTILPSYSNSPPTCKRFIGDK